MICAAAFFKIAHILHKNSNRQHTYLLILQNRYFCRHFLLSTLISFQIMACNITINFTETAADLVANLKIKIETQKGSFTGDETAGTINVPLMGSSIKGSYTINGQQIDLVITDKPFFVSCNQIQNYLQGNL